MTDYFARAERRAGRLAHALVRDGIPPSIAADALVVQALALWAADTGHSGFGTSDNARLVSTPRQCQKVRIPAFQKVEVNNAAATYAKGESDGDRSRPT